MVAVAPQRAFNSFHSPHNFGTQGNWQTGDFVAHFAGNKRSERPGAMRALLRELGL